MLVYKPKLICFASDLSFCDGGLSGFVLETGFHVSQDGLELIVTRG